MAKARDLVRVERDGAALVVTNTNSARRNALTPEFYAGFAEALKQAAADPAVACVIVRGEGSFFCAGGDLNTLQKRREMSLDERRQAIGRLHDLVKAIRACPKPVIAAIEGGAAGAGVSIALACDLIVADWAAKITVAYVKVGLTPDGGATAFLSEALPRQLVSELCLFGDPVTAERLAEFGVVNRLVDAGGAFAEALRLAEHVADGATASMARIKDLIGAAKNAPLDVQLERECEAMATSLGGDEAAEGIAAFLEKRKPDYRGKRGDAD